MPRRWRWRGSEVLQAGQRTALDVLNAQQDLIASRGRLIQLIAIARLPRIRSWGPSAAWITGGSNCRRRTRSPNPLSPGS